MNTIHGSISSSDTTTNPERAPRREVLCADLTRVPDEARLWPAHDDEPRAGLRDAVREAVARALTDKQREALELHFFEGLSQGEIARRLGVSQQVVHKRIHGVVRRGRPVGGALARLREALGARFA